MPKRSKETIDTDDEAAVEDFDAKTDSPSPPKKKSKPTDEKKGPSKGKEKTKAAAQSKEKPDGVQTNSEGDKFIYISNKRRVTVKNFKGTPMVDIREFYMKDGEERPGNKGISLLKEQWIALKDNIDEIDNMLDWA